MLADAGIAGLVGTTINWSVIPQGGAATGIVMFKVSAVPSYRMAGTVDLVESRVQIDARSPDYDTALAVGRAVEALLSGFKGTKSGVRFDGIFKLNERQDFDDTGAQTFHRVSADYQIWSASAA